MGTVNDVIADMRRVVNSLQPRDSSDIYTIFEKVINSYDYVDYEQKKQILMRFKNNNELNREISFIISENQTKLGRSFNITFVGEMVNIVINNMISNINRIQDYETRKVEEHHNRLDEASRLKEKYINLIKNDKSIDEKQLYIDDINHINFEEQYNNLTEYEKELMKIYYQAHGIHSGHLGFIGGKKKRKSRKNKTKNKTRKTKKSRKNNKKK